MKMEENPIGKFQFNGVCYKRICHSSPFLGVHLFAQYWITGNSWYYGRVNNIKEVRSGGYEVEVLLGPSLSWDLFDG